MISIIIPIYNEEKILSKFIKNIFEIENINTCQIIFIDGKSTDKTNKILLKYKNLGYEYHVSPKKGRAYQMNYGTKFAKKNILWFLHADSLLEKDVVNKIINSNFPVGCLKIKFEPNNILMYINSIMSTRRVKKNNIAFGDQGIFIKKKIFNKINGYAEIPIMEDIKLSNDITKFGYKINILNSTIITSSRRYNNKFFKTIILMKKLQKQYKKGIDIHNISNEYKDIR